ncbi:hypothetical protein [Chromobacterium sphagni]|nr:hypothetical protein [Chromobacterium sphagni]
MGKGLRKGVERWAVDRGPRIADLELPMLAMTGDRERCVEAG